MSVGEPDRETFHHRPARRRSLSAGHGDAADPCRLLAARRHRAADRARHRCGAAGRRAPARDGRRQHAAPRRHSARRAPGAVAVWAGRRAGRARRPANPGPVPAACPAAQRPHHGHARRCRRGGDRRTRAVPRPARSARRARARDRPHPGQRHLAGQPGGHHAPLHRHPCPVRRHRIAVHPARARRRGRQRAPAGSAADAGGPHPERPAADGPGPLARVQRGPHGRGHKRRPARPGIRPRLPGAAAPHLVATNVRLPPRPRPGPAHRQPPPNRRARSPPRAAAGSRMAEGLEGGAVQLDAVAGAVGGQCEAALQARRLAHEALGGEAVHFQEGGVGHRGEQVHV